MNLIASGRSVGRHAARMAVLSSRYDQVAASVLFHVGSDKPVAVLSAERRTREMMQVLQFVNYADIQRDPRNIQETEAKDHHEHDLLSLW